MSVQKPAHERLLIALADLVHQVDISEYRDTRGHPAQNNLSFIRAQAMVDEFGVSHEDICRALETCGDDLNHAAGDLVAVTANAA